MSSRKFFVRIALVLGFLWPSIFCQGANAGIDSTVIAAALEKTPISAGEPVLVDIRIHAPRSSGADFDPGYDSDNIELKVVGPDGRSVARPPVARHEGMKFSEAVHVDAGKQSVFSFLASEWFSFERPGHYVIEVGLRSFHDGPLMLSTSLQLDVLSRDVVAMRRTCSSLLDRVNDPRDFATSLVAARALSSIKDEIAIPYISAAIKRREFASLMIDALAKSKTKEALQALKTASETGDPETMSLAHLALRGLE
jgi:hypothetical protein